MRFLISLARCCAVTADCRRPNRRLQETGHGASRSALLGATLVLITAPVPAGSSVALRVQCSDGPGVGDLVECGIDDVSVCAN